MADDAAGAVRRTPRPYPSTGDHQTPETGAPVAPGATNPATPVSQDAGTATGDLRLYEVTLTPEIPVTGGKVVRVVSEPPGGIDQVVAEFAALPECEACGGSGKDDHASPFEAPLAVHFAGPPVEIAGTVRQLCMWCGHVLLTARLVTHAGQPPTSWPVGTLVRIEDGLGAVVPHEPGGELPPGCCALPDDEEPDLEPRVVDVELPRLADEEPTCACDRPVRRCSCRIADLCTAAAAKLDESGPDEAQETRAAADWPAEPVDQHWDEREPLPIDPGDAIDGGNTDEDGDDGA